VTTVLASDTGNSPATYSKLTIHRNYVQFEACLEN
jgi:hypothetical protein